MGYAPPSVKTRVRREVCGVCLVVTRPTCSATWNTHWKIRVQVTRANTFIDEDHPPADTDGRVCHLHLTILVCRQNLGVLSYCFMVKGQTKKCSKTD